MTTKATSRVRDPDRRERIVNSAAELVARSGYTAVSLDDIGAASGIVGSGIYRYFKTKVAILVEMFNRVVDRLVSQAEKIARDVDRPDAALLELVRSHVHFTMAERSLCVVYLRELKNLPSTERRALRWKQRHYVDLWIDLIHAARPELTAGQAQVRVHAAISAMHSFLLYHSQLDDAELAAELVVTAAATLGISSVTEDALPPQPADVG